MAVRAAKEPPALTGVQAAEDRVRETAKWLIVAFAAVGTTLIAGSQLSDLGTLQAGTIRFWVALAGVMVALGAVVAAIVSVSQVLVGDPVSLGGLSEGAGRLSKIREQLEADEALVPDGSVSHFRVRYLNARAAQREAYEAYQASPSNDTQTTAQLADANARFRTAEAANILEVARFLAVAGAFRRARFWLAGSAAVAAIGVVAFAAAANPAGGRRVIAFSVPGRAVLQLSARGSELLAAQAGRSCQRRRLDVILLGVGGAGADVVTQPAPGCRSVRLTVSRPIGSVRAQ